MWRLWNALSVPELPGDMRSLWRFVATLFKSLLKAPARDKLSIYDVSFLFGKIDPG